MNSVLEEEVKQSISDEEKAENLKLTNVVIVRIPLARALVHLNLRVRKAIFAVEANIPQVLVVFNIFVSLLIHLFRLKRKDLFKF